MITDKIKVFNSGLTILQLKKTLHRKHNNLTKILIGTIGFLFLMLSFGLMYYSVPAGIIILLCLLFIISLALSADYLAYIILENCYHVWLEDTRLCADAPNRSGLLNIHKVKIQYKDIKSYYVGKCNEQFIPAAKGIRVITPKQCQSVYGNYINLLGNGINVLAVIPYTAEREQFLQNKCRMAEITEDEYYTMLHMMHKDTQQEIEIKNEYNGYIN